MGAAATILTLRLAAARFGAARWGEVVTAIALVGLVTALVDGGLFTIATRELARPDPDGSPLLAAVTGRLLIGLAAAPLLLAVVWALYPDSAAVRYGVAALLPRVALDGCRQAASAVYVGLGMSRRRGILEAATAIPGLAAAVLASVLDLSVIGFLSTTAAGEVVVAVFALRLAWRLLPTRRSALRVALRTILATAAPLAAVAAINVIYLRADSILLSLLRPSAEVGRYGVAYSVMSFVMAIPSFFMLAMLPRIMHASSDERSALARRAVDQMTAVGVPVVVGLAVLSKPLLRVLAGPEFAAAAEPLSILMIAAGLSFLSAVFGNLLIALDRQRQMLPVAMAVATVNLVANLLLIPRFGASGAAAGMAVSEALALVAVWSLYRRIDARTPGLAYLFRPVLLAAMMIVVVVVVGQLPGVDGATAVVWMSAALAVTWRLGASPLGMVPWRLRPSIQV